LQDGDFSQYPHKLLSLSHFCYRQLRGVLFLELSEIKLFDGVKFMKKYLLTVSAVVLLASGQSYAADVVQTYDAPEVAPVAVAPAFSWDGGYIGVQAGGSWGDTDASLNYHPSGGSTTRLYGLSLDPDGFVGGLYAGYNFAFANNVVLSLETDFVWGNVDDNTGNQTVNIDPTLDIVGRIGAKQKWAGATRVRAGYAMDRFLPYVAAGVAYTQLEGRIDAWGQDPATGAKIAGSDFSGKAHETFTGWTLGVGADYAMTDNILLRAEYRYSDYGKKTWRQDIGGGDSASLRIDHTAHDLRLGVAYKF